MLVRTFGTLLLALVLLGEGWVAAEEGHPSVEIVLFTPSDVAAPKGATGVLQRLGRFTEEFLVREMTKHGYAPNRKRFFSRDDEGRIHVRRVVGTHSLDSGRYDKWGPFGSRVCTQVVRDHDLPRNGNQFWIFVWLGGDRVYREWRGTGGPVRGGHCLVPYPNGGDFSRPKTYLHEFGHTFGLPHVGPTRRDDGHPSTTTCNLMGPNDKAFRTRMKRDYSTFHLTPATAAMLWRHPVLSGSIEHRDRIPMVTIDRVHASRDEDAGELLVTGHVRSDVACHSVIAVDDARGFGDYWRGSAAGRIRDDGSFSIRLPKPRRNGGTVRLVACAENGSNTGNGESRGLRSAVSLAYEWRNGRLETKLVETESVESE